NHLDIAAKEVFEDALLDFPGTVLIVSHDRYLLNKIPTRIFELSTEGIESYLGGYDYYLEKKQSISSGKSYLDGLGRITSVESSDRKKEAQTDLSSKEARMEARRKSKEEEAQKRRLDRDLADTEASIATLEKDIHNWKLEMCKEEIYSDHVLSASYLEKIEEAESSLNSAYERWAELHERI
ncbi:MAG: hypothetical protein WC977_12880, partial [Anaerovoracaceae bacterium]